MVSQVILFKRSFLRFKLHFDFLFISTVKFNDSVSFSFLFSFFVKDQITPLQRKQIVVFLKCFVCVFISLLECHRV